MSLQINIDKILNSSNNIFEEILNKVAVNSLKNARKELKVDYDVNVVLMDTIEFSLEQLREEEGFVSQFLYDKFGIGKEKNRRRSELIMLGGQLKGAIRELHLNQNRIKFHEENLFSSIENLTRLSEAFGKKLHKIDDENLKRVCEVYLKEIYLQIDKANSCQKKFAVKKIYLESSLSKYDKLLRKIPRYHELQEERTNYMLTS